MSTSIDTSLIAVDRGVAGLKQMTMVDLQAMYCNIVKAPQAPKFSDKTAAAKRIIKLANEVLARNMESQAEQLAAKPAETKKPGRPKQGPREYMFVELPEGTKFTVAKQAINIYQNTDHGQWMAESDLRDHVEHLKGNGTLDTKQSSWRIFQYYRAAMIGRGMLKMRNAENNS